MDSLEKYFAECEKTLKELERKRNDLKTFFIDNMITTLTDYVRDAKTEEEEYDLWMAVRALELCKSRYEVK